MTKKGFIFVLIMLVILLAGGVYFYFFLKTPNNPSSSISSTSGSTGFNPFDRTSVQTRETGTTTTNISTTTQVSNREVPVVPILRLLSANPIGGYGAMDTASTTAVRWIDRGRGNVFEAEENSLDITTLSNTLLPHMYQSVWNKDVSAFVGTLLQDGNSAPTSVYAALVPQSIPKVGTSTLNSSNVTATLTPFTLKGSSLPNNVIGFAKSPKGDKVFILVDTGGSSAGYVGSFGAKSLTQLFTSPLTQLNVDWPADNIITITTKGSAAQGGYLYFVNPTTGVWTKTLGPIPGLSARVSHDGKYALVSSASSDFITTTIYDVQKGTNIDAVIRTIADKCAWGNFYKNLVYCGVPTQQIQGTYPDDWYKGTVSFSDKIWQVNAETGEVHLISPIVDQSDRIIDAFNLGLDAKDTYLFFINKNDLSFWSLDLVDTKQ